MAKVVGRLMSASVILPRPGGQKCHIGNNPAASSCRHPPTHPVSNSSTLGPPLTHPFHLVLTIVLHILLSSSPSELCILHWTYRAAGNQRVSSHIV
jgi:hypothetical protein